MNEDLHRHLDGDLPREGLSAGARGEAEAWERLLDAFRRESEAAVAPPWLETRVMAEIEALPRPGTLSRIVVWLLNPRTVRVSPLLAGAVTAGLAAVLLFGSGDRGTGASGVGQGPEPAAQVGVAPAEGATVVFVQFALEAPGATSVAVTGDFDGWSASNVLSDADGDGVWTGRVPVRPGVHAYMFLVDGSSWVTDPRADRYAEDGFGNRNAILAVTEPTV